METINFTFITAKGVSLFDFFAGFLREISFSFGDFLDILIVFFLIFLLLSFSKKTHLTPIIFGIFLFGLIYEISILLNLRLTQIIFNALFGFILVILAIIFQRELRRFFGLIGLIGLRRKITLPTENVLRTISQVVKQLSKNKMGAIIVLPGQENIDRHLDSGIALDGRVSLPLLLSIFDESSPGHDGAVIIEGDRIKKFSVHLPLAENIEKVRKYGTRHRAALGLAELSDAFVIVISEEKGTISIAHNKNISTLKDNGQLENLLKEFYEEKFPQGGLKKYSNWLRVNTKTIITSLLLAFSLWVFFTYQTSFVQRKFTVPIQFKNLNQEYIVESFEPEELVVIFSGRESNFKLLDPKTMKATIDLSKIKKGFQKLPIEKEYISHPSIISISKIEPKIIELRISDLPRSNP
ncbi:MAG: diadenylate cyclase [bacterium]|nr:diadenylate cyclase [bacterium]